MVRKRRVHELAKELGVTTSEMISCANALGISVKSGSSTLEAPVVRRLRESFESTIIGIAAEMGVPVDVICDYVRHLGWAVQRTDAGLTPQLAAQIRKKFRSARGRSALGKQHEAEAVQADVEAAAESSVPRAPRYVYVLDQETAVGHHRDYLGSPNERALCGHVFVEPNPAETIAQPDALCDQCVAKLPEYHARWWQGQVTALEAELTEIRDRHRQLEERCVRHRKQIASLQKEVEQRNRSRQPKRAKREPKKRVQAASASAKRPHKSNSGVGANPPPRTVDPSIVRKRLKEMQAPRRPKTAAEKWADEAAAETMRSHKPSTWRVGRSPSSYR
jgi:hypothetical protein